MIYDNAKKKYRISSFSSQTLFNFFGSKFERGEARLIKNVDKHKKEKKVFG